MIVPVELGVADARQRQADIAKGLPIVGDHLFARHQSDLLSCGQGTICRFLIRAAHLAQLLQDSHFIRTTYIAPTWHLHGRTCVLDARM